MAVSTHALRRAQVFEQNIPPQLRLTFRAFVIGYVSSTFPQLLSFVTTYWARRSKAQDNDDSYNGIAVLMRIFRKSLGWQRFPFFCAVLAGVSAILVSILERGLSQNRHLSARMKSRTASFLSAFIAAWLSLKLLQSKRSEAFVDRVSSAASPTSKEMVLKEVHFAGRTIDLTLFAFIRASDAVIGRLWARRKARLENTNSWTYWSYGFISRHVDSSVFATSCALIMWAWIYVPERLPKAYDRWLTSAAAIDGRLTKLLRRASWGDFMYGQNLGPDPLLESMCADYGWPKLWSYPTETIPLPCTIVHVGNPKNLKNATRLDLDSWQVKSCEYHAWIRFKRSFFFGSGIYVPLNLMLLLRQPSTIGLKRAFLASIRSSIGLGSFIALFYYGVCLARTRIGPKLLGTSIKARQRIDSGLCIASGCLLCGWSILIESASRRKDMALFVAPRALAVILPRRYDLRYQYRENLVFAFSIATIFTCLRESPQSVRGQLGKVLGSVLTV